MTIYRIFLDNRIGRFEQSSHAGGMAVGASVGCAHESYYLVGAVAWWEELFGMVSSSCDSKADVCASISILSSAISSGLTCPGCHWITTGKSVSRMRVSLDYYIYT